MTKIHSQDEPLLPELERMAQNDDSDATFALPPDDPARMENRGGLEAVLGDDKNADDNANDRDTRSEYSSG